MKFVHHLTLHFPIVMTMALAALGAWTMREESPATRSFLRWAGWATLALTTAAAVAGVLAAPGPLGGQGPEVLRDHRDLGVTAWCVIALAAWAYDQGERREDALWRRFGVATWGVGALAAIGAGHWGGLGEHAEVVPF